ncbi:MAG: hypothetical protein KIT14_12735 [bacterium]|nr:hypothetical protein [bacterium]
MRRLVLVLALVATAGAASLASAGCRLCGGSPQAVDPAGRPRSSDGPLAEVTFLVEHRDRIWRSVSTIPEGVEVATGSPDAKVADLLRRQIQANAIRLKEGRPNEVPDPLVTELYRNGPKVVVEMRVTDDGMRLRATSSDPWVVKLIQAHAEVVDRCLVVGWDEVHRAHPLPPRDP